MGFPASNSSRMCAICVEVSEGLGPNRTPLALAACLPAAVLSVIREGSKSAIPANTVSIILPAGVVVSARGSASDLSPAPLERKSPAICRRSVVDRARRSNALLEVFCIATRQPYAFSCVAFQRVDITCRVIDRYLMKPRDPAR